MTKRYLSTVAMTMTMAMAATLGLSGCGGGAGGSSAASSSGASGEYVVERTTNEGVETVRSVSGSRWGGEARLVEELAIGEESGDEPYLFGSVTAAWVSGDRIYVVDAQAPAVRAYDAEGAFLFRVGRTGEGPGEYSRPMGLAIASDGRVFVTDLAGARLNVYDADGKPIEDRSLGSPQSAIGLQLGYDDEIFTRIIDLPANTNRIQIGNVRMGMQQVGPEGLTGEPIVPPPIEFSPPMVKFSVMGNEMEMPLVPYAPSYQWAMAPGGEMIAGVSENYRFEIHRPDGATTIVEKAWEPVAITPGEAAFRARLAGEQIRRMVADFEVDTALVPDAKAAFTTFRPDRSRRVWVVRQGPGRRDPDCTEVDGGAGLTIMLSREGGGTVSTDSGSAADPEDFPDGCWTDTWLFDVFDLASGELLGTVPAPEDGFTAPLFVDGDTVLASITDEAGTVRLKKYRLTIDGTGSN